MAYRDIYDNNSIRDYIANHFGVMSILEGCRINNAYSHRINRLKRTITQLLQQPCIFITLTFTDDVLKKTSFQTRRTYVRRFLKSYNCDYVANVDYGEEREREHYHCILPSRVSFSDWKYGIINFKPINNPNNKELSMYISKLTNHSIKHTTKRHHIIYSRQSKE